MPAATATSTAVNGINGHSSPSEQDVRNRAGIAKYTKFWDKDSALDTDQHNQARLESYEELVNGYYDGATQLYEYGWGQNFHFARYYKGEGFFQALARHEHYLAAHTGIKPGMRVLDVGCGVGGPAREISRFSDAGEIIGLNNNLYQIGRARKYTKEAGLEGKVSFVKGDFMKLAAQFGENSFDAVYAIEATCHASSFEGVYGEIFKVLKPGGVVGIYEWCMTDGYDPSNPAHRKISHGIEVGDGIAEMRPVSAARNALKSVGFQITHEEDLAARDDPIPWYYPLRGRLSECQTLWDYAMVARMTTVGKFVTQSVVKVLETVGLAPKGTHEVGEALKIAAEALVAGGEAKLFTPMMLFVCRKPE